MWDFENVRIYRLDEHRFVTPKEIEVERELAYQAQARKIEEQQRCCS